MKFEPDQPVVFDLTSDSCSFYDGSYTQPVQFGDITQIQAILEPCENNLITDGGFCLGAAGPWGYTGKGVLSYTDCGAVHTPGSATILSQPSLSVGEYYRIEVSVETMTAGIVRVLAGLNEIGEIRAPGNYIFFGFCDHDTQLRIHFNTTSDARISEVGAYRLSLDQKILINDSTGTTLSTLNVADYLFTLPVLQQPSGTFGVYTLGYSRNLLGGDIFTLHQDYLTIKIDWNDLSLTDGCYFIGVADACTNTNSQNGIHNDDFTITNPDYDLAQASWMPDGWTVDTSGGAAASWAIATDEMTLTGVGGGSFDGSTQWLNQANAAFDMGNNDFSMSCIVKFDSVASTNIAVCGKWIQNTGDHSYMIYYNGATTKLTFVLYDGSSVVGVASTTTISANTAYFVVAAYDATANLMKISVDGETYVTQAQSTGANASTADFMIGKMNDGAADRYLDGVEANVMFWGAYALSQAQVTTLYNSGNPLDIDDINPADAIYTNMTACYNLDDDITNDYRAALDLTNNGSVANIAESLTLTARDQCGAISYDTTIVMNPEIGSRLRLSMGTTNGTWRTDEGTFTETLTGSADGDIVVTYEATHGISTLTLDSVSAVLTNTSDYVSDFQSQLHNVKTTHNCSVLIHMVNNHNAYGFEFEQSTFIPTIRLYGRIRTSQYTGDREMYWDGVGNKKLTYARRRKLQSLLIEKVPERVHDFLFLGWGIDHFYVNNNEYVWTDDEPPSITWNQFKTMGAVDIEIESKLQDKFNINRGTQPDAGGYPPSSTTFLGGASEFTGDNLTFADDSNHTINPGG